MYCESIYLFTPPSSSQFCDREEALFSMKPLLDCNIFLIHAPCPSVIIFLPNSHEFSKANYDTWGFHFFSLDAFAWLLHLTALQRQAEILSSLFVVRKLNGKLVTVPHSALKYKQLCICVCKYKQLWNPLATSESLLSLPAVEDAKTWNQKLLAITCTCLLIIRWHSPSGLAPNPEGQKMQPGVGAAVVLKTLRYKTEIIKACSH